MKECRCGEIILNGEKMCQACLADIKMQKKQYMQDKWRRLEAKARRLEGRNGHE